MDAAGTLGQVVIMGFGTNGPSFGAGDEEMLDEIRETDPTWTIWTGTTPGGESAEDVSARLTRVVEKARADGGRTLVFGHGHALRALAACWLGLPVADGRLFRLDTATISVLGHERETPVLLRWNS